MNPYILPGLRNHLFTMSFAEKEERIRNAINEYYGYESVRVRYKRNLAYGIEENIGRSIYCLLMIKYTGCIQQEVANLIGIDRTSVCTHLNKLKGRQPESRIKVIECIKSKIFFL